MGKTMFIAGKHSDFFHQLIQIALYDKNKVIATKAPAADNPFFDEEIRENLHFFAWNRRSPVSARSSILHSINHYQGFDEAIILFTPIRENKAFHEITSAEFEEVVDSEIKGYMFLIKEILAFFQKNNKGTLSFVLYTHGADILSPIDTCMQGAFRSLANSLFTFYQNEPLLLRGFQSNSDQYKDFAHFVIHSFRDKPEKSSGKWNKFTGKPGLFSFVRG